MEVPQSADVSQLKRLFYYNAHNQLIPGLQVCGLQLSVCVTWMRCQPVCYNAHNQLIPGLQAC